MTQVVAKVGYCIRCPTLFSMKLFIGDTIIRKEYYGQGKKYNKKKAIKFGLMSPDGTKRSIFHSKFASRVTVTEKKIFVNKCVVKAFDSQGRVKKEYRCSNKPEGTIRRRVAPSQWRPKTTGQVAFANFLSMF